VTDLRSSETEAMVDRVYRESVPAITAVLTRMLGPDRLDTVEAWYASWTSRFR
jgi:hypothetical protein